MPNQTPSLKKPQPSGFTHQGYHIQNNRNKPHPNPSTTTTNMILTLLNNFIPTSPIENAHTLHILHIAIIYPLPTIVNKHK